MKHGEQNEINAVATLSAKIIPVIFPDLMFCEEGAYYVKRGGLDIMVVSPDGILRAHENGIPNLNDTPVTSIEIKCPFPTSSYTTPVHYSVPIRYVCQCLLEQYVLKSKKHIFVSWSKESTTVFEVPYDQEIVDSLIKEVEFIYYSEYPKRPTTITAETKRLGEKIRNLAKECKFLGEFPSVVTNSIAFEGHTVANTPYKCGKRQELQTTTKPLPEDLALILLKTKSLANDMFTLCQKKASEVVVFSIADVNRIWSREISHGMPIGYIYRGYSLSTDVMKRISDIFLKGCEESGLHIPCITFDGQWVKLKDEDSSGAPLSSFQLKRNFWKKVTTLSKEEMIATMSQVRTNVAFKKIASALVHDPETNTTIIRAGVDMGSGENPLE